MIVLGSSSSVVLAVVLGRGCERKQMRAPVEMFGKLLAWKLSLTNVSKVLGKMKSFVLDE